MRTATIADFKIGTTLYTTEGYSFTIVRKYMDGVWIGRGTEGQGDTCMYEDSAQYFKVKI